jgi:MinD-like ATPase involved in chromosome partitioning or flagellar assembly
MSKIISLHSFRGGTGKSNLTANLAVTAALGGGRVGIIDTDIQSPGVHILFGMKEGNAKYSLNDYLWERCRIEETAFEVGNGDSPWRQSGGSLFLIPSSLKTGDIARVLREGYDPGRLNDGIRDLVSRCNLDYLFIDTHPGVNEETLLSIAISDALVLIMRPDQQDYQGTAVTLELARRLEVPQIALVINKVLPIFNFGLVQEQAEKTFDASVAAVLPLSDEMVELASGGIFCLRHPEHPFTHGVQKIARRVLV